MKIRSAVLLFTPLVLLSGCFSGPDMLGIDRMQRQIKLSQALLKDPDPPPWRTQREKITQALGDRVFDKEFNRVFDSLVVAIASMEGRVENMERQSGYISASGNLLPAEQMKQLRREGLVEWCRINGYDPDLLEKRGMYDWDIESGVSMHLRTATAMTISCVKQGDKQTKVKLRFNDTYYPRYLEELYKAIWPALDKQIFLDKNLD